MTWQEVLSEYCKLNDNNDDIMSLSPQERAVVMLAMFSEHRHQIIKSLPKDLPEKEFKKQLYYRTHGEHLPEDFSETKTKITA